CLEPVIASRVRRVRPPPRLNCAVSRHRNCTLGMADQEATQRSSRWLCSETAMNHGDIEGYRARLTTLLRRVEGTAARAEEQARSPLGGEAGGGISNAPLHLGDLGSESLSQEIAATLLDNETSLRDQIADALERIDSGRFGKCEECGQPIARERLD